MAELFGFEFKRKDAKQQDELPSFTPKENDDGAAIVAAGGSYGTYVDLDGTVRTEAELVTRYRDMSMQPECDAAVDEIVNEAIDVDSESIVDIKMDGIAVLTPVVKKRITEEFNSCLRLLDFNKQAYEIFRRWYVDGRVYFHFVIDEKRPADGIKELRYIDPRKIRKIREISKKRMQAGNMGDATIVKTVNEYYIFNDKGFAAAKGTSGGSQTAATGLRIARDSILHIVSGVTDNQGTTVLSYLHKSIKPLNQLRTLEDALVIYRLARAPERRIWYIDVGNLPKMKAEQYVRDIMVKHKNRLNYDAQSGEVRDERKFMTMLEDYWLPRREGGRGTEVTTLPGGQTLGQMDDVLYFQKLFLNSLNVPVSRLNSDALFSLGRATEITRDELKFSKFISRLRGKFATLFTKMLEKQVVLKKIMTIEEWNMIAPDIKYEFAKDNYFTDLKNAEIAEGRINLARNFQDMAGKYYSHLWIRRNILRQSDEDIETMDIEIENESESGDPRWINPMLQPQMDPNAGMMPPDGGEMPPPGAEDTQGGDPGERQKAESIRQAKITVETMKKKGSDNRSAQDQSKYKAAVQVLAKNGVSLKGNAGAGQGD